MPYVDGPRCQPTFHAGPMYELRDSSPRCGHALDEPRPTRRQSSRHLLPSPRCQRSPDWEAITGSQFTRPRVTPTNPDEHDHTPAAP